jgi:DNA primase catalytic subunit
MDQRALRIFWETLCPWDAILAFCLAGQQAEKLRNTEFMFDLANGIAVRNDLKTKKRLRFQTAEEMRRYVIDPRHSPVKSIHRGLTYYELWNWKEEKKNKHLQHWQPLVLDVDATDYEDIRTCVCGKEKRVCKVCWDQYVVTTVDVIISVCKRLGFKRIQTVFSGRRGMHVYVLDEKACSLLPEQREMVAKRIKNKGVRLDEEVTYASWHLLKLPCTPHGATGNVCCPLSPEEYRTFDPTTMATHYSKVTTEQMQYWVRMLLANLE